MSDASQPPEPDDGRFGRGRRELWTKVVIPVTVAVLGAIAVAALTPAGDRLREVLFPTSAAVTGAVLMDGAPARGAQVTLGDRALTTGDDGVFLFDDVDDGTHSVDVKLLGARPVQRSFTVARGASEKKLDPITLTPLATLEYAVALGQPRFDSTTGQTPEAEVDYDLRLWLQAAPGDAEQIASVVYRIPAPIGEAPVAGAATFPFCYRKRGVVALSFGGSVSDIEAVVELRDGRSLTLSTDAPSTTIPPSCPVSGTTTSRPPPPSTPPPPSPPASPPTPPPAPPPSQPPPPPAPLVVVPSVVRLPVEQAQSLLQAAGLNTTTAAVTAAEPAGTVVAQHPAAGASVARGARVTLDVSTGSTGGATVPDVVGQTQADATATLQQAGFRVSAVRRSTTDPAQDGVVLEQSPTAGGEKDVGTEVTVTVGEYSAEG